MRGALVHRAVSERGGCERFGLGFARFLVERQHQVDLWCMSAEGAPPAARVRTLQAGGRGRIWKMLSLWRSAAALPREDYDVIVGLGRTPGHQLYRAGGGCHRAWVEEHGWSVADAVEVQLDQKAVMGARRVVANSRMAGAELQSWYGLPAERLTIIHNGVDLARFRPEPRAALPVPGPALVFLANGFNRKGLDTALRALALLPGLHLAIVGSDPRPSRFQRLAARLGVAERAHFLGPLEGPERWLPSAAALILPTRYDPFANVVLEALACGVPALSSGRNGAAEILPEPWMIVPDPSDAPAFASAVERALQEPGLRDRCRAAAESHPAESAYARLLHVAEECRE